MRRKVHIETENGSTEAPAASAATDSAADVLQDAPVSDTEQTEEEVAADPVSAAAEEQIAALRARIEELEKQVEQEHNQYLRTLADFQNFRRRHDEQQRELQQFATRELILGLLPILDNFERALAAAEKNQSYEALVGGIALTLRQFQDFLKKNGVEAIEAVGKEFDPNFHEAVVRVEDGEHPENTIVDEVQRGYTMHSRVLRPSMVKVARSG